MNGGCPTWQVTVLGLGPIWMSRNEKVKRRAAEQMKACLRMIRKPSGDERRYEAVWAGRVLALDGAYEMNA